MCEYLQQRNIPEDSLEANSIREGYEVGYKTGYLTAIEGATMWLLSNVYDYLVTEDQERVKQFREYVMQYGYENNEFVSLVKRMREAQERETMLSFEEDEEFVTMICVEARKAERKVDEYLKKMEE